MVLIGFQSRTVVRPVSLALAWEGLRIHVCLKDVKIRETPQWKLHIGTSSDIYVKKPTSFTEFEASTQMAGAHSG